MLKDTMRRLMRLQGKIGWKTSEYAHATSTISRDDSCNNAIGFKSLLFALFTKSETDTAVLQLCGYSKYRRVLGPGDSLASIFRL